MSGAPLAHEAADLLDRLLAGDLALGVAADAVGDDEEAERVVAHEGVFVVRPAPPLIGETERSQPRDTTPASYRARFALGKIGTHDVNIGLTFLA